MSPYEDFLEGHQRLAILRHLNEAAGGCANDSLLHGILLDLGLGLSRDQLRTEISWLGEQRLVTVKRPREGVLVAYVTERGVDVATGAATVPGVRRPSAAARTLQSSGEG